MKFKLTYLAAAAYVACNLANAQVIEGSTTPGQTAIGSGAVSQLNGTAVGALANAGLQAVAVGGNANANAQGAVAVGGCINIICIDPNTGLIVNTPLPVGQQSTAVGGGSRTAGNQSTALGANANASNNNSVALGAGSQTTRDNSVEVGGRQITGVAAGSAGTDAVNVDQLNAGLGSTLNQANAYTDAKSGQAVNQAVSQSNSYTDSRVTQTLNDSKSYTDARVTQAIDDSKAYTDAKAITTLNQANSYTDARVTQTLNDSKAYTDEKTKYFASNGNGAPAAQASGFGATAMGPGSVASGGNAIAAGLDAQATADGAVVFGSGSVATAVYATALGSASKASGESSVAAGHGASATGLASVALGQSSSASGARSTAMGPDAVASGNNTLASGWRAQATGDNAVALGNSAKGSAANATAVGNGSAASGISSTALGNASSATGDSSVALGNAAVATNAGDVALGSNSVTAAAVGTKGATLNGIDYAFAGSAPLSTVSVGDVGKERTVTNVAAGRLSATSTDVVNGSQLNATNVALNALGTNVNNLGASTAANFGGGATYDSATGAVSAPAYTLNGVTYNNAGSAFAAIGSTIASTNPNNLPPASATGGNSVAIGPGSVAERDNSISIGAPGSERVLTNVAPGTAATDATNLGQVRAMVDTSSRDGRAYTDERVNALDAKTRKQMAGVGAMAMAATALLPNARAEGRTSFSAAMGTYGGASAIAAGVNYYVSNNVLLNARLSVTTAGPAKAGAAVGVTWGF